MGFAGALPILPVRLAPTGKICPAGAGACSPVDTFPRKLVFILRSIAYLTLMSQTPTPRRAAPQSWIDAIARSEADLAAGRMHDFETVLRELEAEDADLLKAATHHSDRRRAAER